MQSEHNQDHFSLHQSRSVVNMPSTMFALPYQHAGLAQGCALQGCADIGSPGPELLDVTGDVCRSCPGAFQSRSLIMFLGFQLNRESCNL